MKHKGIHISDDFFELAARTIDERQRVCIGDIMKGFSRVQIYQNKSGEILIRPVVEIPASEAWLFKNKKALEDVRRGLEAVKSGKVSKLDLGKL